MEPSPVSSVVEHSPCKRKVVRSIRTRGSHSSRPRQGCAGHRQHPPQCPGCVLKGERLPTHRCWTSVQPLDIGASGKSNACALCPTPVPNSNRCVSDTDARAHRGSRDVGLTTTRAPGHPTGQQFSSACLIVAPTISAGNGFRSGGPWSGTDSSQPSATPDIRNRSAATGHPHCAL